MKKQVWPMVLDLSPIECKQTLRKLELEAYSTVVSALRAQGDLNREKKQILQQLSRLLSITLERHQAEIRRAVNDEKLNTIAHNLSKESGYSEWAAEGRRLSPLINRVKPRTPITLIADAAAELHEKKVKEVALLNKSISSIAPENNSTVVTQSGVIDNELIQSNDKDNENKNISNVNVNINKRKRVENECENGDHSQIQRPKIFISSVNPTSTINAKINKSIVNTKVGTPTTVPRVVLMTQQPSSLKNIDVTQSINTLITSITNSETSTYKAKLITTNADIDKNTAAKVIFATGSSSSTSSLTNTTSTGSATTALSQVNSRLISARSAFPSQLVVFPGNQQKTIALPIAHQLKTSTATTCTLVSSSSASTSLPSSTNINSANTTTLVYHSQSTPATIKGIPGTFTIQTFKPSASSKIHAPNLIIMPAVKAVSQVNKLNPVSNATIITPSTGTVSAATVINAANAKGLTRHISTAKIAGEEKHFNIKPNGSIIEIQASGAVLQNLMKSGQLNKEIIEIVQKVVSTGNLTDAHGENKLITIKREPVQE